MAQINVRITDEDRDQLEKIGQEMDRSISWLVRKAITQFIEGHQVCENKEEEN
jgi:predicted transcriptional regulator